MGLYSQVPKVLKYTLKIFYDSILNDFKHFMIIIHSDNDSITVIFLPSYSKSLFDIKKATPIPIITIHTISPDIVPTIRLCLIPILTVNIMGWTEFDYFKTSSNTHLSRQ